jgi:hypothetical protein
MEGVMLLLSVSLVVLSDVAEDVDVSVEDAVSDHDVLTVEEGVMGAVWLYVGVCEGVGGVDGDTLDVGVSV